MGNSLVVQWLGLCAFTATGPGSIPARGTKIPKAAWHGQRKKKKKPHHEYSTSGNTVHFTFLAHIEKSERTYIRSVK